MTVETIEPVKETQEQPSSRGADKPPARPPILGMKTPPDWPTVGLVAVIVLLGLALRLWGIGWSLPDARHPAATYHPDELINLNAVRAADIPHLQFDIGFYNYGAFYFYLVSFAQLLGRAYGLIPTAPLVPNLSYSAQMIRPQFAPEQAALFLTGRLVTALLGTATIVALFALGSRMYGRRTGFVAALLYALAPLAVVHAHFLTVDVPATFFVALTLLWSARLLTRRSWSDYVLAGVWAGLAAATKYNAGLVLIAPIVANFLQETPEAPRRSRRVQFAGLLGAAILAFLIGCPGALINFDAFWNGLPNYPGSGVRYELFEHSRQGHGYLFTNTGPGWWYHLVVSLPFGLGIPLLLLSIAGLAYACVKRGRADWVLLAFFLLYYGATGLAAVRFARYMIPLFPVLCVLAARLVTEPYSQRRTTRTIQAIGALVTALTAVYTISLTAQMARPDPRDVAADYLNKNLPQGASVAFATVPWFYSPPLSPYFGLPAAPERALAAQQTTRYRLRIPSQEWDTAVLSPPPDAVVLSNIETMHPLNRLHLPAPTKFVRSIPSDYKQIRFDPDPILLLPPHSVILPEDLLYILPTITLYRKP